jgi:trigger factor
VKVSVEKLPTSEAVLEVDVTWDELEKASNKVYQKLVQKVDIQGFRRGKAPRALVERRLGKEYIYQESLDELISEAYRNALKEHDLTPISQPKLDGSTLEIGQPYHFSLTVPIMTPVELPDYRLLHFEREEVSVTSEEVDEELASLRNHQLTWEEVQRPVQYGDRIKADLKLISGEQTLSDLKDNLFEITSERHGLFTGMDEHIVGMTAGESKSFTTTIPTDYSNEKFAGKEANYDVVVHLVEEKSIPELDNAFAAKISESRYETLEDLSKALSDNILEKKKRRVNEDLRKKVLGTIIEQSRFAIHPLLIEEEAKEMAHQFGHMLEHEHLSMDQYLKMVGKSREEYLEEVRPEAEERVKRQLVLEGVAQKERIGVEAEELEALLNAYSQMGQELPHSEDQLRALAFTYRREKALSLLIELTTDPDTETEDEEAENEASIVDAEAEELTEHEGQAETEASRSDMPQSSIASPTNAADASLPVSVANAPQTSTVLPISPIGKGGEGSVEIETER